MSMFNGANAPTAINPSPIMPGSQVVIPQITIPQTPSMNRVVSQQPILCGGGGLRTLFSDY